MNPSKLQDKLSFIFFGEDSWRLRVTQTDESSIPAILIDVHGMKAREAERTLWNVINIVREPLCMTVVHGYRHGTVIKDVLAKETFAGRLKSRYCPKDNPGLTVLRITT